LGKFRVGSRACLPYPGFGPQLSSEKKKKKKKNHDVALVPSLPGKESTGDLRKPEEDFGITQIKSRASDALQLHLER